MCYILCLVQKNVVLCPLKNLIFYQSFYQDDRLFHIVISISLNFTNCQSQIIPHNVLRDLVNERHIARCCFSTFCVSKFVKWFLKLPQNVHPLSHKTLRIQDTFSLNDNFCKAKEYCSFFI